MTSAACHFQSHIEALHGSELKFSSLEHAGDGKDLLDLVTSLAHAGLFRTVTA